jgi:diketogulonate reductase-like aldo/keto reductase
MVTREIRRVPLPGGETVPSLGQGTWHMAEDPSAREAEISALQLGLDLGLTLIDTAEMYANGGAETLVGEAIRGRRDEVFLVSKVLPSHASHRGVLTACEQSLRRLQTDRLDLYLLHWRGGVPLAETVDAFDELQRTGLIRHWGVSNFDIEDMRELVKVRRGADVATNQVLYNLGRRGIEFDLLPWCQRRRLPIMAYSPIEQGRLLPQRAVGDIAASHGATATQVALAWVLRHEGVLAIPKSGNVEHVRDNVGALRLSLSDADLAELDRAFPPPDGPEPLEML